MTADRAKPAAVVRLLAAHEELLMALDFYADPQTYHAIAMLPDPPCGEFMEDFDDEHGDGFYDRPMPGARARKALRVWHETAHTDVSGVTE